MLERTDGSEMCISVMTVILESLGVASTNGEVVERCVTRPEEMRMYGIQRNAGKLFLRANPWEEWSRGSSVAKEMCFPKGGSCCKLRSGCVTEKLSMCCCNEDRQTVT